MNQSEPIISIIVPVYNRPALVRECLASIAAQTFSRWECIVVDDGSTDETPEAVEEVCAGEPRMRLLRVAHGGPAAARNAGAAEARGEWLAFCDSDDLWAPTKLAAQWDWLERHPQFSIMQCDEVWMRGGKRVNRPKRHRKFAGDLFEASLERCMITPSAVVLRRELYFKCDGFDQALAACEDYALWLRIVARHAVGLLPATHVTRRAGREDNLSDHFHSMDRFRVAAIARLLAEVPLSANQYALAVSSLREKCRRLALGSEKRNKTAGADYWWRLPGRLGVAD